jgi:hypothetical protein
MWKLGQLKPGDRFRMTPVCLADAVRRIRDIDQYLLAVASTVAGNSTSGASLKWQPAHCDIVPNGAVLKVVPPCPENPLRPKVTYRQVCRFQEWCY